MDARFREAGVGAAPRGFFGEIRGHAGAGRDLLRSVFDEDGFGAVGAGGVCAGAGALRCEGGGAVYVFVGDGGAGGAVVGGILCGRRREHWAAGGDDGGGDRMVAGEGRGARGDGAEVARGGVADALAAERCEVSGVAGDGGAGGV